MRRVRMSRVVKRNLAHHRTFPHRHDSHHLNSHRPSLHHLDNRFILLLPSAQVDDHPMFLLHRRLHHDHRWVETRCHQGHHLVFHETNREIVSLLRIILPPLSNPSCHP